MWQKLERVAEENSGKAGMKTHRVWISKIQAREWAQWGAVPTASVPMWPLRAGGPSFPLVANLSPLGNGRALLVPQDQGRWKHLSFFSTKPYHSLGLILSEKKNIVVTKLFYSSVTCCVLPWLGWWLNSHHWREVIITTVSLITKTSTSSLPALLLHHGQRIHSHHTRHSTLSSTDMFTSALNTPSGSWTSTFYIASTTLTAAADNNQLLYKYPLTWEERFLYKQIQ